MRVLALAVCGVSLFAIYVGMSSWSMMSVREAFIDAVANYRQSDSELR